MVHDETGELRVASWPEALDIAARGLAAARAPAASACSSAAASRSRTPTRTPSCPGRARHERRRLPGPAALGRRRRRSWRPRVAGRAGRGVTYADARGGADRAARRARARGGVADRLPAAAQGVRKGLAVQVARSRPGRPAACAKLSGRLVAAGPGTEAEVLDALPRRVGGAARSSPPPTAACRGAVVLVGERMARVPGALSAAVRLAGSTGARVAWVPRRAGERGALEAGACPSLLPGGRPVADPAARVDVAAVWGLPSLPPVPGRDTTGIIAAAASGRLGGLVVGGVDPADLPDPVAALAALDGATFVVSLEVRRRRCHGAGRRRAAGGPAVGEGGHVRGLGGPLAFLPAGPALHRHERPARGRRAGRRHGRAAGAARGRASAGGARRAGRVGGRAGGRPDRPAADPPQPQRGTAVLATWHLLLDDGTPAGRRALPRGHPARPGRPDVARHRRRDRRGRRRLGDGVDHARRRHAAAAWSPRWPTASSGCRPTRRTATCAPRSASTTAPSSRSRRARQAPSDRSARLPHVAAGGTSMIMGGLIAAENPSADFSHDNGWLVLGKALVVFVFLVVTTLIMIWAERRVVARMQLAPGPEPDRAVRPAAVARRRRQARAQGGHPPEGGRQGRLHPRADHLGDHLLPRVRGDPVRADGPDPVHGHHTPLQLTDLNVAVLFVLAVAAVGVYGIVLAGWSSGSTYPLLGGLRSSAQVISLRDRHGPRRSSACSSTPARCRPRRSWTRRPRRTVTLPSSAGTGDALVERDRCCPSFVIYSSRWSARPTVRRSTCPRPRASWSAASTPSTPR